MPTTLTEKARQFNLKNKANKETGKFICNQCGCDVSLGMIIHGRVYCMKCGEIIKGIRDG